MGVIKHWFKLRKERKKEEIKKARTCLTELVYNEIRKKYFKLYNNVPESVSHEDRNMYMIKKINEKN